ncbi:unnamed protein product [Parajaminaea phylloscopi]
MAATKASDGGDTQSATSGPPPALLAPTDRAKRPLVVGDQAGPSSPFPIYLSGTVQRGFGRGGKELGCPTANLPSRLLRPSQQVDGSQAGHSSDLSDAPTGVYYGYARLLSEEEGGRGEEYEDQEQREKAGAAVKARDESSSSPSLRDVDTVVHPMVMSLGWNPFYANKTKTAEVHLMHPFKTDFYGLQIKVVVLGYIRPEYNYVSLDALRDDIETDKQVALRSLERTPYQQFASDAFFTASRL